ncbi:unnamed protein product [Amoebophrya sp. A120]|nr:unnamed protein product [Amoebophrya sp. A120]|eukprot:GSA120T00007027001.1
MKTMRFFATKKVTTARSGAATTAARRANWRAGTRSSRGTALRTWKKSGSTAAKPATTVRKRRIKFLGGTKLQKRRSAVAAVLSRGKRPGVSTPEPFLVVRIKNMLVPQHPLVTRTTVPWQQQLRPPLQRDRVWTTTDQYRCGSTSRVRGQPRLLTIMGMACTCQNGNGNGRATRR